MANVARTTIRPIENQGRGRSMPTAIVSTVPQIAAQIVDDPKKSGYWAPYKKIPQAMPERARLEAAAEKAIRESVVPAFQRLEKFWAEKYLPACKPNVGVWQLPDGKELYAYTARHHTTTKLTPDQIHGIGLREVARIRAAMEEVKTKTGFAGFRRSRISSAIPPSSSSGWASPPRRRAR